MLLILLFFVDGLKKLGKVDFFFVSVFVDEQ